jgi:hypothetical protein
MARTRLIKPGFFSNDLLAECDPLARLLFAGLWTIVDRDGRMVDRRARIKAQLLPYDDCSIDALLGQLVARGFVQVYAVDGVSYLQVTGFAKHQNPHKKEASENLPEPPSGQEVAQSRVNTGPSRDHSGTSPGDSGTSPALTLNPSPLTLDPSPLTLNPSLPSVVGVAPRKRRAPDPLRWSMSDGFTGYTDEDLERWRKAYPLVDIEPDIVRCAEHVRSVPSKQATRNWRKMLVGWFARSQRWAVEAQAKAKAGRQRDESHIPDDVHPDDRRLFFSPEGKPREPAIWRRKNGEWCV